MLILSSLMLLTPAILMIIAIPQADAAPPVDVTDISVKPAIFSPDGDGSADEAEIFVSAGADQNLVVNIYDDGGKLVLEDHWVDQIEAGLYWGTWNGSRANGGTVPNGVYEIRCSTTGAQGGEDPQFNATVRVHTAPLIMTLFTPKGEPIPEDDQVVTGDVLVELATDISPGEPAYGRATLDRFMDNRWLPIGNDTDPDDGWGIPWSITGVPDGTLILRGTLHGPNGSRLGNLTTVLIERPKPPVLPRIELSEIVLWTNEADAKYPPLWLKVEVTNKETRPVDLTLTFSTDLYQLETVFLTVNGSDSRIIDSYWGRDADVTTVSVHAYHDGVELASTTEPIDIEDGSEKDDEEALLTEDDLPLALVGAAATVMVAASASFGLGLRRCIKLRVRPPSPRRKRKEEKKQEKLAKKEEKQARKQKKLADKEGNQAGEKDGPAVGHGRGEAGEGMYTTDALGQPSGSGVTPITPSGASDTPPPVVLLKYGMPCLDQHLRISAHLDGKGNDIIPDSISTHPSSALHPEYAIACQRAAQTSNYLRSMGIDSVTGAGTDNPTILLKYGITCSQALSALGRNTGIEGVQGQDGMDPVMNIKYGIACTSATAGLSALDGKGDNGVSAGSPMNALDGKGNDGIPQHDSTHSNKVVRYDMDMHFGKSKPGFGGGELHPTSVQGGIREQPPPQNVMFNPAELDIKKTVPWNQQTKEGKGDHSVPNLQFTEGGPSLMSQQPVQPQPYRFVCQNCGRIAGPGFHTCGYCGGRVIKAKAPGSFQDSGSGMTADQAMTPNRRPEDHIGPNDGDDDDKDNDDSDKDDDGDGGENQQQPEKQ